MKLAIIGSALAGGAIQIVDILQNENFKGPVYIYDDDNRSHSCDILGVPVVGNISKIQHDFAMGKVDSAIIAVGSIEPRERLFNYMKSLGIQITNVISSFAIISKSAKIGCGNVILPMVYIGPNVIIGDNNYLTTATQINHDSKVGSHCYMSANVTVAGRVQIGDRTRADTSAAITADAVVPKDSLLKSCESYGPFRDR